MSQASVLLDTLMTYRAAPKSAQLTSLEVKLERAWGVVSRWGWIFLVTAVAGVLLAAWLRPVDPVSRTLIMIVLLLDFAAWYGSLVVVCAQAVALVFLSKVRHAHEVHWFIHQQAMAMRVATFAPSDLDEAEHWLKWRVRSIRKRTSVILGGQVGAGSILAAFQNEVFRDYVNQAAAWLASVLHMAQTHVTHLLTGGAVLLIIEVLAILSIASRYHDRVRVIEHARILQKSPSCDDRRSADPAAI